MRKNIDLGNISISGFRGDKPMNYKAIVEDILHNVTMQILQNPELKPFMLGDINLLGSPKEIRNSVKKVIVDKIGKEINKFFK